jgi:hypothetical protein
MTHSQRSHTEPLSNVELERYAPSIFATQPWHQMSDKYQRFKHQQEAPDKAAPRHIRRFRHDVLVQPS